MYFVMNIFTARTRARAPRVTTLHTVIPAAGMALGLSIWIASGVGRCMLFDAGCALTVPSGPVGSAEQFRVQVVARHLVVPWALAFAPDGRLFITERPGRIRVVERGALRPDPWADLPALDLTSQGLEIGLMGTAVDPLFHQNGFLYVCYSYGVENGGLRNRIVRLKDRNGKGVEPITLVDAIPGGPFHDGCRLKFGPDGKLYATMGDGYAEALPQEVTSLAGKVLRINPDGSIPPDNPFPNSPVWSYGHRNPQGMAWQPATNRLFITEHGTGRGGNDELNIVERGKNYGWPIVIGAAHESRFVDPILVLDVAPAGATFVTSDRYPGLKDNLLFVTLRSRHIQRVVLGGPGRDVVEGEEALLENQFGRLRDIVEGPDGYLYICTSNRDGRGQPASDDDRVLRLLPK